MKINTNKGKIQIKTIIYKYSFPNIDKRLVLIDICFIQIYYFKIINLFTKISIILSLSSRYIIILSYFCNYKKLVTKIIDIR